MNTLLPRPLERDAFNAAALKRDGHACVRCGATSGLEVHHLLDRKLWGAGGGNYLDNAVTVCSACHILAERTLVSCEELRALAGIRVVLIPEHLGQGEGECYDKWGNQVLPTGVRLKGELFNDTGCQRMLESAGLLGAFAKYVKYPRTMHLPQSPNLQNDDRRIEDLRLLQGDEIVISEKRDGECTSFYPDLLHARSVDSKDHPSRAIIRQLHGAFRHEIPNGWRICGENLYAQHSIAYSGLRAVFEVFNIWDENNVCLSWDETREYCSMIGVGIAPGFENGLPLVPVLYRGKWDDQVFRELEARMDSEAVEGYVVRSTGRISYSEWRKKAAKYVRAKHVRTDEHWMRTWKPNEFLHLA